MRIRKGSKPERSSGWVKPFLNGVVWQKPFGVKVGHIHRIDQRYVALFDGRYIGTYDSEARAKEIVDAIGNEWLR